MNDKLIDKNCTIEAQLRRIDHLEMILREKEKNVSNVQAEHDWQTLKMEFEHQLRVFKEREIILMQTVHEQEKQLKKFHKNELLETSETQTDDLIETEELEREIFILQNEIQEQKFAFETEINKHKEIECCLSEELAKSQVSLKTILKY